MNTRSPPFIQTYKGKDSQPHDSFADIKDLPERLREESALVWRTHTRTDSLLHLQQTNHGIGQ